MKRHRTTPAFVRRAQENAPEGFEPNANVKLFRALSQLMLDGVPGDPARDEYRQGNTLSSAHRHWRWVKIGRRFRLFFRYDSKAKVIVYVWVNDEQTLRSSGSKSDPYAVFEKMLGHAQERIVFHRRQRHGNHAQVSGPVLAQVRYDHCGVAVVPHFAADG